VYVSLRAGGGLPFFLFALVCPFGLDLTCPNCGLKATCSSLGQLTQIIKNIWQFSFLMVSYESLLHGGHLPRYVCVGPELDENYRVEFWWLVTSDTPTQNCHFKITVSKISLPCCMLWRMFCLICAICVDSAKIRLKFCEDLRVKRCVCKPQRLVHDLMILNSATVITNFHIVL
jgi:hypothetical protein